MLTDVRDDGEAVAASLGAAAAFVHDEVTDEAQWNAAASTVERFGHLGVLVNNAGIGHSASIADHTRADFEQVVAVNQTGVFLGMRAVIPAMIEADHGSIINVSQAPVFAPPST